MVLLFQAWLNPENDRDFLFFFITHQPLLFISLSIIRIPPSDDPSDLKAASSPNMDNEMTAKERGVLEEDNEKEEMDQERSQEDEGEERKLREEGEGEGLEKRRKEQELLTEEQELEELKAQVLQLLLELDEARETSNKHQESFHELQGEKSSLDMETLFINSSLIMWRTIIQLINTPYSALEKYECHSDKCFSHCHFKRQDFCTSILCGRPLGVMRKMKC